MLELEAALQQLNTYKSKLTDLKAALHLEHTADEISELEAHSAEPNFWDDVERAQEIQTKINHLRKKLERYTQLLTEYEDIEVMIELGHEEEDEGMIEEVLSALTNFTDAYEALRLETLFTGEHDHSNAILTLHAGSGGTEAQDWAEMLFRMYSRWAEAHEFELKVLDYLSGDVAGIKSVSFKIDGENAYGYLRSEMGVHRLVRISPFDSSGRRHTSFASLEVLPEFDQSIQIEIRPEDIKMDVFRASGAGGQHINKTSSAVRLTHIPTGLVVACQNERSQFQNRDVAMALLKAKLFTLAQAAQLDKIEDLKGDQMEITWGSQIRSYVFCPYTMVKDHRTGYEKTDVSAVMDGDLDGFINAYLSGMKIEK